MEKQGTTVKERLKAYLSENNISMAEFGRRIGVSPAYITSMRKSIQPDKVERIKEEFPDLDIDWLLTGQPKAIDTAVSPTGTPVYDVDATMGTDSRPMQFLQEHVIGYVNMPNISKNAAIIRANGDSMTPVINDGNFIAVREITDFDDIFYGQIYLVVTAQNRMVKYVRKNKDDEKNYVILRSENKEYDDILMPKAKILKMFIVENILSLAVR